MQKMKKETKNVIIYFTVVGAIGVASAVATSLLYKNHLSKVEWDYARSLEDRNRILASGIDALTGSNIMEAVNTPN